MAGKDKSPIECPANGLRSCCRDLADVFYGGGLLRRWIKLEAAKNGAMLFRLATYCCDCYHTEISFHNELMVEIKSM